MKIKSFCLNVAPLCAVWVAAMNPGVAMADRLDGFSEAQELPLSFVWATVANSASAMPGSTRLFNSFSQPSVNSDGLVAMRARSKGEQGAGQPLRGIYARKMARPAGALTSVFDTLTTVPEPNNTLYSGQLGTFTEFPAFPRIGLNNNSIVTRGQSKPVWTYTLADLTETRTGTSGVYLRSGGVRLSAVTQLGAVPGFQYFSVPGATAGTKFDQFPGSPAVADANTVVFKGNYTDGVSKTGIFFRRTNLDGRTPKVQVIASSDTLIPGQLQGGTRFGSTAPPSASAVDAVFVGLDNEETPTLGGLYRAPLATTPRLQTLVTIGGQVPGEARGVVFSRLGEGLSYDGRFIAFWGSWGRGMRSVTLNCPVDGQAAVIAYCNQVHPTGLTVQVPLAQGFFIHDLEARKSYPVVKAGGDYLDFLYWTFSGRPPGVGESDAEDFEAPRWRSAAFVATFGRGSSAQVAFKGRKSAAPVTDGIYLAVASSSPALIRPVVETNSPARLLDPAAPVGAAVTSVGVERDSLRNGWLAITASMLDPITSESWAGVYTTRTKR